MYVYIYIYIYIHTHLFRTSLSLATAFCRTSATITTVPQPIECFSYIMVRLGYITCLSYSIV